MEVYKDSAELLECVQHDGGDDDDEHGGGCGDDDATA